MGRIVAIDFGLKRIGIAVSDESRKIAFPLTTVPGGKQAISAIQKALTGRTIDLILIGLPLLLTGQEGDMAKVVKEFGAALGAAFHVPVEFVDERFTSQMADRSMREIYLNRKERSAKVDEGAATVLLQSYLERHAN
jgi:putative Holliday junction resolvase